MMLGYQIQLRRPLVPVWAVTAILDCTEDDVIKKIESGDLAFAFDLRCKHSRRACIRVSARCVSELQANGRELKQPRTIPAQSASAELDQVIKSIVPSRVSFRSGEVARLFNCNLGHLDHLAKEGLLSRQPIRGSFRQTYKISRESIVKLLKERRMV